MKSLLRVNLVVAEIFVKELPQDTTQRIDAKFHNPKTIKKINELKIKQRNRIPKKLIEIAERYGGKRLPKGTIISELYSGVIPYVRVTDVKDNIINIKTCPRISYELSLKLKDYRIYKGDLAITIVGTVVGDAGVLIDDVDRCNLNENVARIKIIDPNVDAKFLCLFLNSRLGKMQTERLAVGSLQNKLSLNNVEGIEIYLPLNESKGTPDIKEQEKIVSNYNKYADSSLKKREEFFMKVKEIRDYIKEELKIPIPEENEKYECFSAQLGDRFDAFFNSPFRKKLIANLKKFPYKKFSELVEPSKPSKIAPKSFYNIVELDNIDENLGLVLSHKEVPNLKSQDRVFKKGEILVSKLDPKKGKIVLVDDKTEDFVGSSELVGFVIKSQEIIREYLWIILRSDYVLKQWEYEITGSSRERIGKTEFNDTIIPLPDTKIQEKIVNRVMMLHNEAVELLKESQELKQKAMELFEKELISGAG